MRDMTERMRCRICGAEMRLVDRDFNFKGNYDNYWVCDHCDTVCTEKVRYGRSISESWSNPYNDAPLTTGDDYIYGYPPEIWNTFTEDEQIAIQDRCEYDLQHPDQKDWFIE